MTRQNRARLFLLVLALGLMAGVLATPATRTADAGVCCDACQNLYESCQQGTYLPACQGNIFCCANEMDLCFSRCSWC